MTSLLTSKLPKEMVDHIKLFTGEGHWRNGKYINIRRIPRNDFRYAVLRTMPIIKQVPNDHDFDKKRGCLWYKLNNGKFVVVTVRYRQWTASNLLFEGYYREVHYDETTHIYRVI